jgi:hypothetical protein
MQLPGCSRPLFLNDEFVGCQAIPDFELCGRARQPKRFCPALQGIQKGIYVIDLIISEVRFKFPAVNDVLLLRVDQFRSEADL